MEKPEQRQQYRQQFQRISALLTPGHSFQTFLSKVENHDTFRAVMESNKGLPDSRKRDFILLEFTNERSECNEIIRLLEESGLTAVAEELKKLNTSPGLMTYTFDIEIPVNASHSKKEGSMIWPMTQNPRGRAVIINNMKDCLSIESQRFEHIFKELLFDVELVYGLTANEIEVKLTQIRDQINSESTHYTPQALVVMVLSHGRDEKVFGVNGCVAIERGIKEPEFCGDQDYLYDIQHDVIGVKKITDLLSKVNFPFETESQKAFPKMFFFICCRDILEGINLPDSPAVYRLPSWEQKGNSDIFVCYSCLEGFKTFYDAEHGISYYGQALSHSLAQEANKFSVNKIVIRTNQVLEKTLPNYPSSEIRMKTLTRDVYFNPKWSEGSVHNP